MDSSYPSFSIVTCTYNRAGFIKKALDSVENQTYKNFEHVINDSYSTDGTVDIINAYIGRNSGRYPIKFFQTKPNGIARAMNDALAHCENDVINFLHSDDFFYTNDALEKVAGHFKADLKLNWLIGNFVMERNRKIYIIKLSKLLALNPKRVINTISPIHHENTFIKTKYVKELGEFDESRKISIEVRLWLRMIRISDPLIVDDNFSVMVSHPDSASSKSALSFLNGVAEGIDVFKAEHIVPAVGPYNETRAYKTLVSVQDSTRKVLNKLKEKVNGYND